MQPRSQGEWPGNATLFPGGVARECDLVPRGSGLGMRPRSQGEWPGNVVRLLHKAYTPYLYHNY